MRNRFPYLINSGVMDRTLFMSYFRFRLVYVIPLIKKTVQRISLRDTSMTVRNFKKPLNKVKILEHVKDW